MEGPLRSCRLGAAGLFTLLAAPMFAPRWIHLTLPVTIPVSDIEDREINESVENLYVLDRSQRRL
jgi:hypothetical protein